MRLSASLLGLALLAGSAGMALAAGDWGAGAVTNVQATGMTDAQIQQKLEAQGYSNVRITDHDKDHVDVTASKGGKPVKLAVNPQSGQVTPDTDND
jgi:hypothetical protein